VFQTDGYLNCHLALVFVYAALTVGSGIWKLILWYLWSGYFTTHSVLFIYTKHEFSDM